METEKLSQHLNAVTVALDEVKKKSVPFDAKQVTILRELANESFEKLSLRVENMKKEVFSEIIEAEMIMTGLCDEDFE